jgi:hypothetical protein
MRGVMKGEDSNCLSHALRRLKINVWFSAAIQVCGIFAEKERKQNPRLWTLRCQQ